MLDKFLIIKELKEISIQKYFKRFLNDNYFTIIFLKKLKFYARYRRARIFDYIKQNMDIWLVTDTQRIEINNKMQS